MRNLKLNILAKYRGIAQRVVGYENYGISNKSSILFASSLYITLSSNLRKTHISGRIFQSNLKNNASNVFGLLFV